MTKPTPESLEFLKELTELTRKHKIAIGGCGCCESPWIYNIEEDGNYVLDDEPDGRLTWQEGVVK